MRAVHHLVVVLTCAAAAALPTVPAVAAEPTPTPAVPAIEDVPTTGAPLGGRGGVFGPYVRCGPHADVIRAVSRVTALSTGAVRTYRWDFSGPNPFIHRGPAGAYRVTTRVVCPRRVTRTRTQTVEIVQKTRRTTMSRREFRQVRRGMTVAQVAEIVGHPGTPGGRFGGRVTRIYDSMPFWSLSSVTFRRGLVVAKLYDFGHD